MEQLFFQNSFPELKSAIEEGFCHSFRMTMDGLTECLSNPGKLYDINELIFGFFNCPLRKATIYLIATNDGLFKGTLIDYWEHDQ